MKKTSAKLKEADDLIGAFRSREEELLEELAGLKERLDEFQTDHLTDLMPGRLFNKILEKYFQQAQRNLHEVTGAAGQESSKSLVVLVIDVDRFSMINDKFGSDFGDLILQFVAMVISKKIRGCDMVTRKGQQFKVALIDCDRKASIMKAQEIAKRINRQTFGSGQDEEVKITVTIGLATCRHSMTLVQLREKAFCAMKHGKDEGDRNSVAVFGKNGEYQVVFKPS